MPSRSGGRSSASRDGNDDASSVEIESALFDVVLNSRSRGVVKKKLERWGHWMLGSSQGERERDEQF
jgi:hypothetical protein